MHVDVELKTQSRHHTPVSGKLNCRRFKLLIILIRRWWRRRRGCRYVQMSDSPDCCYLTSDVLYPLSVTYNNKLCSSFASSIASQNLKPSEGHRSPSYFTIQFYHSRGTRSFSTAEWHAHIYIIEAGKTIQRSKERVNQAMVNLKREKGSTRKGVDNIILGKRVYVIVKKRSRWVSKPFSGA